MSAAAASKTARAIADLSAGTILASVEIAAPIERVFRALTSPEEIVRWWGSPDSYRTTEWTSDMRPGGKWRARGVGDQGPFTVGGEFIEVDPPRKLVQTWQPDWDGGHVTTITYRLDATATGTRVTVRHEGFGDRADSCAGHTAGWEQVLGWLAGHAAPEAAPSRYFMIKLLPPRPSFPTDMTEAEAKIMHDHVAYWRRLLAEGRAIVFGPVADPRGAFGLGVLRVRDEAELAALQANDPARLANIGFGQEALPMLQAVHA
jgi:uncharacterized protein YndB with AHSA1/START domain/uncharacterized protein YciI